MMRYLIKKQIENETLTDSIESFLQQVFGCVVTPTRLLNLVIPYVETKFDLLKEIAKAQRVLLDIS